MSDVSSRFLDPCHTLFFQSSLHTVRITPSSVISDNSVVFKITCNQNTLILKKNKQKIKQSPCPSNTSYLVSPPYFYSLNQGDEEEYFLELVGSQTWSWLLLLGQRGCHGNSCSVGYGGEGSRPSCDS